MAYNIEDTQNSAPGQPSLHEAAKLSTTIRRQDNQSVTKRYADSHDQLLFPWSCLVDRYHTNNWKAFRTNSCS